MNVNKKMINYFKRWDGIGTIGIGMMGVGIFLIWIQLGYYAYVAAMALIPIGAAVFIYGNIGRASGTQIEDTIKQHWENIRFPARFPELEETPALRKRTPKEPEILDFEGYEMEEGLYFKKLKDASVISSKYTCIKIVFLSDALYLKKHTFSFISDEKSTETIEIPFASIQEIDVIRNAMIVGHDEKNRFSVKTCHVCIHYGDGQQLLLPKKDDIYVEEFAQDLKEKCSMAK